MPRLCTAPHLLDPRKEEDNRYLADAEVDLEFASGVDEQLKQPRVVFDFKLQGDRNPQHWVGHFDFESPVAGGGVAA